MKRSPLPPRTTPLTRGKPVKRVRPDRKAQRFREAYHSKRRVEFVKRLPCIVCKISLYDEGHPCVNAHTGAHPLGKKGPYTSIVPLCPFHHLQLDDRCGPEEFERVHNVSLEYARTITQTQWLAHLAGEGA